MMDDSLLMTIKNRFGIIGFDPALDFAINKAVQVAKTDLSVLITGESGVGKENFPKIIHEYSAQKHKKYIAVNCGAIPEGTIDSELFGHEKGAFTGANEARNGYFEEVDGGTLFLDEVADLPLGTQVRLLRVLENGEFIRVGSSKVQKCQVRVVAATNVNVIDRIAKGKFREDLYYRLNTVPIHIPALRERKEDILPLFTKFASDFSDKYHVPTIELTDEAVEKLKSFTWPGNIRQLKNVTEQISLIENERLIDEITLAKYLISPTSSNLPMLIRNEASSKGESFERELVFKFLADMKQEVSELRALVQKLISGNLSAKDLNEIQIPDYIDLDVDSSLPPLQITKTMPTSYVKHEEADAQFHAPIIIETTDENNLSLMDSEKLLIKKALEKNNNNRKQAAIELGISERTLYRKIKDYNL